MTPVQNVLLAIAAGDAYVPCPRCDGHGMVVAWTKMSNGFTPSHGDYFTCSTCNGTGEADTERALEYVTTRAATEEEEQ